MSLKKPINLLLIFFTVGHSDFVTDFSISFSNDCDYSIEFPNHLSLVLLLGPTKRAYGSVKDADTNAWF